MRPGGIVCVHEILPRTQLAEPETPLFAEVDRLACTAFKATAAVNLGDRLPAIFCTARLPAPELRYERVVSGAEHSVAWWYHHLITGLLPALAQSGIATATQLELDTLVDRLEGDLHATHGIAMLPPMIGGWCRVPGVAAQAAFQSAGESPVGGWLGFPRNPSVSAPPSGCA